MALVVSVSKKVIQEDSLWARLSAIVESTFCCATSVLDGDIEVLK